MELSNLISGGVWPYGRMFLRLIPESEDFEEVVARSYMGPGFSCAPPLIGRLVGGRSQALQVLTF